jgi:poly(A) polymerase
VQPRIYTADEHRIELEKIDRHAHYVIQKLREEGHAAYLVGGGVRDLLLGRRPKDFDISTSASPEEVRQIFRNSILIGRRFRLVHVRFGQKVIEVSTFRSGDIESSDLIVRDNEWGSEEEDVLRRDFTINGLFYDPEKQVVIDYVDGYPDLSRRMLRTIGPPEARFKQDPVRMIRLLKFAARFGFEMDEQTYQALLECKSAILQSAPARVLEELLRMLESGAALPFFRSLDQYGMLKDLLPALGSYFEQKKEDNPILPFLSLADDLVQKESRAPDRTLLLSLLLFPLLQERLPHSSHLLQQEIHRLIDEVFSPFFLLPRKTRAILVFLLSTQFRFTPLDGKEARSFRLPKDPMAITALELFYFRAAVSPDLQPLFHKWNQPSSKEGPHRTRRRRKQG